MGKVSLHFVIQGDWMTETSRTAYWEECNFNYARELLGSLIGINEKQIDQILLGEKKLIGNIVKEFGSIIEAQNELKCWNISRCCRYGNMSDGFYWKYK